MDQHTYIITFDGDSLAVANRHAEELRNAFLDASPDIIVQRKRADPHTQDFGATLVLLLGTPAIVAMVNVIGDWLKLRSSASLTIETPQKRIIVQNITSKDVAQLAERLLSQE